MSKYRVTVDTGGTFSDFVFFNEDTGAITISKLPSTPGEPFQAVLNGVKELIDQGVAAGTVALHAGHSKRFSSISLKRKPLSSWSGLFLE